MSDYRIETKMCSGRIYAGKRPAPPDTYNPEHDF